MTFDEFLDIPPCTIGKHSTVDDTPKPDPSTTSEALKDVPPPPKPIATNGTAQNSRAPRQPQAAPAPNPSSVPPESDSDDPTKSVPPNITCRRRGCNATSSDQTNSSRDGEQCVHHPGQALFHEGSKGWTCCKRRVLEFDEFMKIEGCKTRVKHLFVGRQKDLGGEIAVSEVRYVDVSRNGTFTTKY